MTRAVTASLLLLALTLTVPVELPAPRGGLSSVFFASAGAPDPPTGAQPPEYKDLGEVGYRVPSKDERARLKRLFADVKGNPTTFLDKASRFVERQFVEIAQRRAAGLGDDQDSMDSFVFALRAGERSSAVQVLSWRAADGVAWREDTVAQFGAVVDKFLRKSRAVAAVVAYQAAIPVYPPPADELPFQPRPQGLFMVFQNLKFDGWDTKKSHFRAAVDRNGEVGRWEQVNMVLDDSTAYGQVTDMVAAFFDQHEQEHGPRGVEL